MFLLQLDGVVHFANIGGKGCSVDHPTNGDFLQTIEVVASLGDDIVEAVSR